MFRSTRGRGGGGGGEGRAETRGETSRTESNRIVRREKTRASLAGDAPQHVGRTRRVGNARPRPRMPGRENWAVERRGMPGRGRGRAGWTRSSKREGASGRTRHDVRVREWRAGRGRGRASRRARGRGRARFCPPRSGEGGRGPGGSHSRGRRDRASPSASRRGGGASEPRRRRRRGRFARRSARGPERASRCGGRGARGILKNRLPREGTRVCRSSTVRAGAKIAFSPERAEAF